MIAFRLMRTDTTVPSAEVKEGAEPPGYSVAPPAPNSVVRTSAVLHAAFAPNDGPYVTMNAAHMDVVVFVICSARPAAVRLREGEGGDRSTLVVVNAYTYTLGGTMDFVAEGLGVIVGGADTVRVAGVVLRVPVQLGVNVDVGESDREDVGVTVLLGVCVALRLVLRVGIGLALTLLLRDCVPVIDEDCDNDGEMEVVPLCVPVIDGVKEEEGVGDGEIDADADAERVTVAVADADGVGRPNGAYVHDTVKLALSSSTVDATTMKSSVYSKFCWVYVLYPVMGSQEVTSTPYHASRHANVELSVGQPVPI